MTTDSATIPDPFAPIATFTPDVRGDYSFSLVVSDFELPSPAVTVSLTAPNRAPVADLFGPLDVSVGTSVLLSALASTDPDNDALTYTFTLTAQPTGSAATLADINPGEAGFTPDVPGTYSVTVDVSDGLLTTVATLDINATVQNSPPVLGAINALYTVELGLELALDLVGSDLDGDPISFFATPLPLPTGIVLDATTGNIRYIPEAGQEGSYSFTVGVSDGTLTDTAVLNINVVPGTASDTSVYGRVLDAVDFANGITTPLAGMPIRLRDLALMTTTDVNGDFNFGSLVAGGDQINIEPSLNGGPGGYLGLVRSITITANQDRDLAPAFLLTPLNDGCATVAAGLATQLVGTNSGVTVTIAADTIQDSAGALYVGDVCLGTLPQLFAQPGLPSDTQACQIYALDAPGAVFTQGISVTAPNVDQLPEQAALTFWRQGNSNGLFRRTSAANVDTGAATVSASPASFSESTLFTFLPNPPLSVASSDQPNGNRSLTVFEGDLSETFNLAGYRAFNTTQSIGLAYHSDAANPTILVAGDVTIAPDSSLPLTLSTHLNVGGLQLDHGADWNPRLGADGHVPAVLGEQVSLRQSMPVDASGLYSGSYDYDFIAQAKYACSTVSSSHGASFYVHNQTGSPYGEGWTIDDLQELIPNPDGSVSIIDDDSVVTFEPKPTLSDFDPNPLVFPAMGPQGIVTGDFGANGNTGIAFANSGTGDIQFIDNAGGRDLTLGRAFNVADPSGVPPTGTYGPNLLAIDTGDLNNDGVLDIAYATQVVPGLGYLAGDTFGEFSRNDFTHNLNHVPSDIVVVDIDGDGYDDIIRSGFQPVFFTIGYQRIYIEFGGPSGFTAQNIRNKYSAPRPAQLVTGDLDNDGNVDVTFRTTGGIDLVGNVGSRTFIYGPRGLGTSGTPSLGNYYQFADFNGDDLLDFVWSGTDNLTVFLNDATNGRNWAAGVALPRPASASGAGYVNVVDADGDGTDDILFSSGNEVAVYPGNGDGTFQPHVSSFLGHPIEYMDVADVDGDGSLDLISTQRFSVTVDFSNPGANGKYVAGNGEFSTLAALPGGGWARTYKDGSVVEFDANGRQIAEIDTQGNRVDYAYDSNGRLLSKTDQVGGVTSFAYQPNGRLDAVTYPDGRVTMFTYDDISGTLTGIAEPTGSTVSFTYDANNRLVSTTNQNGNTSQYNYDVTGRMNGATLPDGSTISNQVASSLGLVDGLGGPATSPLVYVAPADRMTTVTDRKGNVTEIIVNQFGSTVQITDPLGRVTKITRDAGNLVTQVERPNDSSPGGVRIDTIAYDNIANVSLMTEAVGTPEERATAYEYEPAFNKVTKMTDADGFITLYEYDAFGEATKITDALAGDRLFSYTPEGQLLNRTDENGNATAFTYDANKNLGTITYADGSLTQMSYDASGNAATISEAFGTPIERQIQRTYDALNRVLTVEVTASDGIQIDGLTTYGYDLAGNLATVTDETGLVTSMGYDTLERLTSVADPAEGTIQRVYNPAGEVIQHINGDGEIHDYAYDAISRLTQTTDPEGYVKTFAYDNRDNIATVTDGRGGLTTFAYDPLDRMVTRTNPISQTMLRAYDGRDNLANLTREDGVVELASYDGLSRRTGVTTPDNTLTFSFDPRGNLTAANDNDSGVSFTYDARNRLATTTTDGLAGPQPAVTLTYAYDELDRRLSVSDSLGGTTAYAWDVEDRLSDLTAPWGTVYNFGYDGFGRRTSLSSTTGRASTMGYTNGLLSALSHIQSGVTLTDLAYEYDVDGQLTGITDNLDPSKSKAISYDLLNRLVQVADGVPVSQGGTPIPTEDYAYDGEGNRLASHLSALYTSNAHNQLTEDDDYTYAYDTKGNRVSRTAKSGGAVETYTYDSQNRLVGYTDGATVASYAYDALERRVAKTVDGVVTAYVYDMWEPDTAIFDDILLELENGSLTNRWLHSDGVDEPVGFEAYSSGDIPGTGSAYEVYADRMGSISAVVDVSTGTTVAEYTYDAFGDRTQFAGSLFQIYGYSGREVDDETGLMYFRARYYDPVLGQFIQRDPIGFVSGDLNLYSYVSSNPFNWTDPSGMNAATEDMLLAGLGIGSIITILQQTIMAGFDLGDAIGGIAVFSDSTSKDDAKEDDGDGPNSDECKPDRDPSRWKKLKEIAALLLSLSAVDPASGEASPSRRHVQNTTEISRRADEAEAREESEKKDDGPDC